MREPDMRAVGIVVADKADMPSVQAERWAELLPEEPERVPVRVRVQPEQSP
jgi:hypothetical protein